MNGQLVKLYEAAKTFNKIKFWEADHIPEPVIFQHPKTKELYYCHFVLPYLLRVHIGDAGLYSYLEYDDYNTDFDEFGLIRYIKRQNMMEVEFVDRDKLLPEHYELIKDSGVSFRGKKQWPTFTRMSPGMIPDFLESPEEIEFFTEILEELPDILKNHQHPHIEAVWVTKQSGSWVAEKLDGWNPVGDPKQLVYPNELKAHRVKKLRKVPETWEMTQYFLSEPLMDEKVSEKPFFPTVTLLADPLSEDVLWHHVGGQTEKELSKIADALADFFLKHKSCPQRIETDDEVLECALTDFAEKAGIGLEWTEAPFAVAVAGQMVGMSESDLEGQFEAVEETLMEMVDEILQKYGQEFNIDEEMVVAPLFCTSFMYMAAEHREMLPHWTADAFSEMIESRILEDFLPRKTLFPIFEKLLRAMGKCHMVHNSGELLKIIQGPALKNI